MIITREHLNLICIKAHSSPGCVVDIFAAKGLDEAAQIPAIVEFYNLLQALTIDTNNTYIESLPHLNSFNEGVYFNNDFIIGCLDIEPNTLQYLTYWTTNTVRESKHFIKSSGSFMFVFNRVDNTIIPHIYSYFVIDKSPQEIVPILSLTYLENQREGLDFVEDAMLFIKDNFNMPIKDISSFNNFIVSS